MKSTAPILIYSEGISMAHAVRPLMIAQWLRELQVPIIIACSAAHRLFFSAAGFTTVKISVPYSTAMYQRLRRAACPMHTLTDLLAAAHEDEQLITQIKPTLVMADFRFTALLVAEQKHIPTVNISSVSCHPCFDTTQTGIPEPYLPQAIPEQIGNRFAQSGLGKLINHITAVRLGKSFHALAHLRGYVQRTTFFDYASMGDLCLLCDDPQVMPLAELRPQDIYTGALVWSKPDPLPAQLDAFDQHLPTIYITPGTQDSLPTAFLVPYIHSLLEQNFQVLLSTGNRSFELPFTHKRLVVVDFINNCNQLLANVDLFVHHGGQMSTYLGMANSVPMLALPAIAECFFHARAIENQGVGRMLRPSRLRNTTLMKTTLMLLNNHQVRQQATFLAHRIQSYTNKHAVLERIQNLVHTA